MSALAAVFTLPGEVIEVGNFIMRSFAGVMQSSLGSSLLVTGEVGMAERKDG